MKKIISRILVFAFVICYIPFGISYADESKISDELLKKVNNNEVVDILVTVADSKAVTSSVDLKDDENTIKKDRKEFVEDLQDNAEVSQKDLITFLEESKTDGKVESYESFNIVNMVNVVCSGDIVKELLEFNEVITVEENQEIKLSEYEVSDINILEAQVSGLFDWQLINTKVNKVWEKGYFGDGMTIGVLDTGAVYTDDEISGNWLGNSAGAKYGWYDAFGESNTPVDTSKNGHGTAVTNIAVGKTTGVAPNAKWISARAFDDKGGKASNIIKAAQWFLAPGGDTKYAPKIINNSWGMETVSTNWFDGVINSWIKAGIIPVFASGNGENASSTLGTLAYPATNLDVISVGAVNSSNVIYANSKIGPSYQDNTRKKIKPELTAPGVSVVSINNKGSLSSWTGTSMASPMVAGITALIMESNDSLTLKQIKDILTASAVPIKDNFTKTFPNMVYGYGLINAEDAVNISSGYNVFNSIERISGENRYTTSIAIANEFYDKSKVIYITNGTVYADGLSMGSLTKYENGPLLLSTKDSVSANLDAAIKKLAPKKIVIIGGEGTISKTQETALRKYGATVERVSGNNRFATAVEIAKKTGYTKEAFLVNGYVEADSINIVSTSSRDGIPVLFSSESSLPKETKDYIKEKNISKITVIGGSGTVKQSVVTELENMGTTVERVSGNSRYETGVEVNKKYYANSDKIFFANGINIADALSVGPAAGKLGAQSQIVPKDSIPDGITNYYKGKTMSEVYILGGTGSVSMYNKNNIYKLFY